MRYVELGRQVLGLVLMVSVSLAYIIFLRVVESETEQHSFHVCNKRCGFCNYCTSLSRLEDTWSKVFLSALLHESRVNMWKRSVIGKLAITFPSLEMTIMTSEWRSRVGRSKKGILSNHCILSGPEKVYFECAEMAGSEPVQEPSPAYQYVNETTSPRTKAALKNTFFREYDFDALYRRLIQDYTERHLKYDEDALNAFLASTAECERSGLSLI